MNEISQLLAEKFNLSPETAQQIVQFIFDHVKGKLPEGLAQNLEGIVAQGGGNAPAGADGLLDTVKNLAGGLFKQG